MQTSGAIKVLGKLLFISCVAVIMSCIVLPFSAFATDKLVVKDSGGNTKFVATDDGRVGLGVAIPQYNFDLTSAGIVKSSMHFSVSGADVGGWVTSASDNNFFISSGSMYNASLGGWIQKSSDGKSVQAGSGGAGFTVYVQSGSSVNGNITQFPRLRINYDGTVGIGTVTPTQQLEVNGGVRLNTATTQPACNAAARGTFWVTQGTTDDVVQVCAMKSGSLVWTTVQRF